MGTAARFNLWHAGTVEETSGYSDAANCAQTVTLLMFAFVFTRPLAAACRWTETMVPYLVCTDWWDGIRTCHWQEGWVDVYECDVWGSTPPHYPGGGGPAPDDPPPPHCEIVGISDEDPDQPILSVQPNEAVVEMTLVYDGYPNQSVAPSTDQFALQPVHYFANGRTAVGVQCRSAANVYSTPVMFVDRYANAYRREENVHGVWTKFKFDDEPEQFTGDWSRAVVLNTMETSYTAPTVGSRNGKYQHLSVQDFLRPVGETPKANWDDLYVLNTLYGGVEHDGWSCDFEFLSQMHCTDVGDFAVEVLPNGRSIITRMEIPFQSTLGVTMFTGQEISVGPW
jgi:hypothetical protein